MAHSQTAHQSGHATAVVGLQWGDEGKGKFVDLLAAEHDAVVRYNGGANAGHSVVVNGNRFSLHLMPSGILYPGKLAVVGNGVVVDPDKLLQEIDGLAAKGVDTSGLVVSDRAHVVLPYHKAEDEAREELMKAKRAAQAGSGALSEIGTTRRGIGPCYAEKIQRAMAVRIGDLLKPAILKERVELACEAKRHMFQGLVTNPDSFDAAKVLAQASAAGERLRPAIKDTMYLLHGLLAGGKRILFEGANGTLLDVDHGTYPFVTSSSTGVAGIGSGTGVPVQKLGRVLGIMKSYSTRVGAGPLPTELFDDAGHRIRERGREYGTTTGRPRRVGWLDLVATKYATMINGTTGLGLTMLDVLAGFDEIKVCTAYEVDGQRTEQFIADGVELSRAKPVFETLKGFSQDIGGARKMSDLPVQARAFVEFLQERIGVKADFVSVGPGREQTIQQ